MTKQITLGALVVAAASCLMVRHTSAQSAGSVEAVITQMEKDSVQASIKSDTATMDRIIADDWIGIDYMGKTVTKAEILKEVKAGATVSQSADLGPLKI